MFPLPDWLVEKGKQLLPGKGFGLAGQGKELAKRIRGQGVEATAVVRLKPGMLGDAGWLAPWTREGDALWSYLMMPCDGYTMLIEDIYI